ncbi:AMP-dependent synthetase/ligase [Anaeromyxobacter oryzae]|uniref:Long-chain-fatty-acid--CoA ligase n=1 Tax=Anaeromyxobacter oryzae TaxID=2918170 RepID=A0ABN6N142_9BACT|nr:long-chain fatty acid--CoA ligase [Anaeromyxobacter oryzae]BDG05639.1 long-chain-fatty-acid--CoA ligase [Anaeromyxobacter oryzae]
MGKDHLAFMIRDSARAHGAKTAMRYKDGGAWHSISYAELGEKVQAVAKALLESGIQEGDMVGIFARNAPEWAIADFGILSARAVAVPIYATNTTRQAEYIARDAGLKLVFVGDQVQYDKVMSFRAGTPQLRRVIALDRTTKLSGDGALHFDDFVRMGAASTRDAEVERRLDAATSDDVATVIYTSGTTGDPKGAVLTHANLFHQFRAIDERFEVGSEDRSICFLPLSHTYERTWSYYVFRCGAENDYLADPKDVVTYMPEVRPTAMVSVPRLYEKICATVLDRIGKASAPRRALFRWAMGVGREYQYREKEKRRIGPLLALQHRAADALVLSKIRDVVGGEKNFFSCGGAPLSKDVEEFFFAAGLLICQGYGLTETSPMLTCNAPGAFKFGTVGRPILGCEIKIADSGEILARGGNVMKGYYNKPAETAASFEDGWFKTGDVGAIDEDGYLHITDRIKDLIITSHGKNVAPQHIEAMFGSDPYVEQVAILGDKRNYVSALVVPSFPALEQHAREHGIAFASREELVTRPEIVALYEGRIRALCKDLAGYEQIKRFTLVPGEFTQEGGELTPTLKIKRRFVEQKYRAVIDAMYAAPSAAAAGTSIRSA